MVQPIRRAVRGCRASMGVTAMKKEKPVEHRCAFDICNRRLHDFGWVLKDTGELVCDEICGERLIEQRTEKVVRTWH